MHNDATDGRGRALRVVFYAVNGTGVGHLTRLLAIARWMRRYAAALGVGLEAWFLTTSEADALAFAEGFAAFKIPSKTVVAEAGIDRRAYVALAKQWVWHTLGLLRPDVLVVDTFPRGSFGELLGALDLARRTVFCYRPVRPEVAERPDFQAMVRLYDLVLVPEAPGSEVPGDEGHVIVPNDARDRLVHVGPVLARERWSSCPAPPRGSGSACARRPGACTSPPAAGATPARRRSSTRRWARSRPTPRSRWWWARARSTGGGPSRASRRSPGAPPSGRSPSTPPSAPPGTTRSGS